MNNAGTAPYFRENIEDLDEIEKSRGLILRATRAVLLDIYRNYFRGGETVLEVGSGTGYLRRNLPHKLNGVWFQLDWQPVFLKEARRRFSEGTYLCGSVYELPFPSESVDVVCGFNSYDIRDLEIAVKEASRVLKPDGLFLDMHDLSPRVAIIDAKGNTEELKNSEKVTAFYKLLESQLSQYFNPKTIVQYLSYFGITGRRTQQQRETGKFGFINNSGMGVAYDSSTSISIGNHPDVSQKNLVYRERAYRVLSRILPPLAQRIEPPCSEVVFIPSMVARK